MSLRLKLNAPSVNGSIGVTPLRPVGDVHRLRKVVEEDSDDFAEAQCHDCEIVSAKFQGGCAEQHAEHAGNRCADRQDRPERQVQAEMRRSEQRVAIRADRIKGDVTEVKQPGKPDHDIQAQGKQREKYCEIGDADPRCTYGRQHERQHQQRRRDQRDTDARRGRVASQTFEPAGGMQKSHARSPTRSPSNPDGRNTSTAISTRKANTSW